MCVCVCPGSYRSLPGISHPSVSTSGEGYRGQLPPSSFLSSVRPWCSNRSKRTRKRVESRLRVRFGQLSERDILYRARARERHREPPPPPPSSHRRCHEDRKANRPGRRGGGTADIIDEDRSRNSIHVENRGQASNMIVCVSRFRGCVLLIVIFYRHFLSVSLFFFYTIHESSQSRRTRLRRAQRSVLLIIGNIWRDVASRRVK